MSADGRQTLEIPIGGMDCADCTRHVQRAIADLPGVEGVEVWLGAEKAVVRLDPGRVDMGMIRSAVEKAGYAIPERFERDAAFKWKADSGMPFLAFLGLVFGVVLFVVVVGEWLGFFEAITAQLPFALGAAFVLVAGFPIFLKVIKAAWRKQVLAHTLMSVGALAALLVGEWATAAVVVFFMYIGETTERFTTGRARRAVKDLAAMAPQKARLERDGSEVEVPLEEVQSGEIVIIRPGELIPVDGEVIAGNALVDQATITGEALPVEVGAGKRVFAATLATLGSLRIRATQVGGDTTFGKVIQLVEQAEARRGEIQRMADRFSAYYLPVVAAIAALTYLVRGDALATAAVLVVACSCSFALATPIAMLATIGAAARRGLLIKGGKYLEILAKADVLLIDKTGTLTLGKPELADIKLLETSAFLTGMPAGETLERMKGDREEEILRLAASAERYSEHPLAEAVRVAAKRRGLPLIEPERFEPMPGFGVRATVDHRLVEVGSQRMVSEPAGDQQEASLGTIQAELDAFTAEGKTLVYVKVDGVIRAVLAMADTLRPEVPRAIQTLRGLGIEQIQLLTGDNPRTAAPLAKSLGIEMQAGLLPEDKIAIVRAYQEAGHTVVMVGDGVNDAPALAQADVGIAMGAAGSGVALEAAHIALMREDWDLVPQVFRMARRTMGVVKGNIGFTSVYNLVGLSLAALGFLPLVLAAVAQSLPDLGILANSSRLLRQK
jgi:P-type Cu+ transporter